MAEPGRCASCRWWAVGRPNEPFYGGWGICQLTQTQAGWPLELGGEPLAVGHAESHEPPRPDEEIDAALWAAPTFGCIQWEANPDA